MPTLGNTPRPAYVYDTETDTWVPVGVGAHTHSDIPNTLVDAKGDLITATADNVPARLAKGTDGTVLVADSTTSTGLAWQPYGAIQAAGKNKFINGDCNINQRAFSSQTLTTESSVYIVDRIFGLNVVSGSSTFSVQQFTPGSAPVAGYEAKQFIRAVSTGQSNIFSGTFFGQTIEDVRNFAGQTATVSFWAKAATGTPNVSFEFRQIFGTGGSPSATVENAGGGQKFAISTSWVRYSMTITLPSVSGKTLGTNNNSMLECNIWVSAGSAFNSRTNSLGIQSNTFDIWGLQIEAGPTATQFTTATGTIQGELAACQRYYWRNIVWGIGIRYGGSIYVPVMNRHEMRGSPAVTRYANGDALGIQAISSITVSDSSPHGFSYSFTSAGTDYQATRCFVFLEASAEL
jgi:hypothetical protein